MMTLRLVAEKLPDGRVVGVVMMGTIPANPDGLTIAEAIARGRNDLILNVDSPPPGQGIASLRATRLVPNVGVVGCAHELQFGFGDPTHRGWALMQRQNDEPLAGVFAALDIFIDDGAAASASSGPAPGSQIPLYINGTPQQVNSEPTADADGRAYVKFTVTMAKQGGFYPPDATVRLTLDGASFVVADESHEYRLHTNDRMDRA